MSLQSKVRVLQFQLWGLDNLQLYKKTSNGHSNWFREEKIPNASLTVSSSQKDL